MRLDELARRIQGRLASASSTEISRIASLETALPGDVSFVPNRRFNKRLSLCRASAVIVDRDSISYCTVEPLIVEDVLIALARAGSWLPIASPVNAARDRPPQPHEITDASAVVAPSADIGRVVSIGPNTMIGPGCVVGDGVRIGGYCKIGPNVTIEAAATLGNRVSVGANTVVGGEPFLYVKDAQHWLKVPSFASVDLGDDVELGSNVAIDRGTIVNTTVKRGAKIDNHVHIGHSVVIGEDTAIAAQAAIAGETTIGRGCLIGGAVGIGEGLTVADDVQITAMSMVTKSLLGCGIAYSSGWPVRRSREWWRFVSSLAQRFGGPG